MVFICPWLCFLKMKHAQYISFFLLLFSCEKPKFDIQNLNNEIVVLGHGGMGISHPYPMNSFESISKCLNTRAQGVEIDVQMTKDSILVAYHDSDLSSDTNKSGRISDLYWDEVKDAKYKEFPYLNYSILSLEQLFLNIENIHDHKFIFDCKWDVHSLPDSSAYINSFVAALSEMVERFEIHDKVYFESKNSDFLLKVQYNNPNYKLFIYSLSFEDGLNKAIDLGLYGISISTQNITKEQISLAHSHYLFVSIWNVNSNQCNITAINKNPDFIQSDRIFHLLDLLH